MTTTDTATRLLISRAGIASAAGVQRPVVTIWQRRDTVRGVSRPFPTPVEGDDLFDLDDVIAWQADTGRGNNPEFADDAPLFAIDIRSEESGDSLTALIALAGGSGIDISGATSAELMVAAQALDPDDAALWSEVGSVAHVPAVLTAAARQIESAFGAGQAIEGVLARRAASGPYRSWLLDDGLVRLLARLVEALAPQGPAVAEAIPGLPSDLALRVALADPERSMAWAAPALEPESPPGRVVEDVRLQRRRAIAAGLSDGTGAQAVLLGQIPHRSSGALSAAEMLTLIDDTLLDLPHGQAAVIVAPAPILIDALPARDVRKQRGLMLRTGRLRAVFRLPRGLVVDRPRADLGLWVIGDPHTTVTLEERPLVSGDLSAVDVTGRDADALVADLVAALDGASAIRARAFAHGRVLRTSSILATDGALVPPRSTRGARATSGDAAAELVRRLDRLAELGFDAGLAVEPGAETRLVSWPTVDRLVASGQVSILPGRRLAGLDLGEGTVRIVGAPEVCGRGRGLAASPLLARARVRGDWTEPGDVVFITSPEPAAIVDPEGGAIVEYPARVLRGLGDSARACASVINRLPADATRPRSWRLPFAPSEAAATLDDALAHLAAHHSTLNQALAALAEVEHALIDGATSGALVVNRRKKD